ncbi:hypothetical protein Tco_0576416 [Tanacetum coccineum]
MIIVLWLNCSKHPTVGYEDAIVVPEITTDNFKLKHDHFYDEVLERPENVGKAYAFPIFSHSDTDIKEMDKIKDKTDIKEHEIGKNVKAGSFLSNG